MEVKYGESTLSERKKEKRESKRAPEDESRKAPRPLLRPCGLRISSSTCPSNRKAFPFYRGKEERFVKKYVDQTVRLGLLVGIGDQPSQAGSPSFQTSRSPYPSPACPAKSTPLNLFTRVWIALLRHKDGIDIKFFRGRKLWDGGSAFGSTHLNAVSAFHRLPRQGFALFFIEEFVRGS